MSTSESTSNSGSITFSPDIRKSLEVLLFVHNHPITTKDFLDILPKDTSRDLVENCLNQIARELTLADKPYSLEQISGGWQLLTRPEYNDVIKKLTEVKKRESLSRAQLETLAVISYNQPITKFEIESIRGVGCGPVLKVLQDRNYVRVVGRAERLGAPVLYGTTKHFLEVFGLNDITELPERDDIIKTFKDKLQSEKKDQSQESQKDKEENAKEK